MYYLVLLTYKYSSKTKQILELRGHKYLITKMWFAKMKL